MRCCLLGAPSLSAGSAGRSTDRDRDLAVFPTAHLATGRTKQDEDADEPCELVLPEAFKNTTAGCPSIKTRSEQRGAIPKGAKTATHNISLPSFHGSAGAHSCFQMGGGVAIVVALPPCFLFLCAFPLKAFLPGTEIGQKSVPVGIAFWKANPYFWPFLLRKNAKFV